MSWVGILQPLGVDLFCVGKKYLVYNLVARNLKIKYRRSVLGFLWTLLNPIAMTAMFYLVFKFAFRVQVPHYLAFILSGILFWNFFVASLLENMESLVSNLGLITKIPLPIQVFPLVGTATNLVTLALALPILIAVSLLTAVHLGPSLVLVLAYVGLLTLVTYGLSLILSVAFVFFRDLRHLMTIVTQIWFYATPVIYDESMLPEHYRWVIYLNPVGTIFTGIHSIFVQGEWPSLNRFCASVAWTAVIMMAAIYTRKYLCREIVEQL